ncbi:MAG: DUF6452 family protein [Paludibacteraceae bacterium]|nr:DUF6452 family protein [Paludibacteraceae bacterium]
MKHILYYSTLLILLCSCKPDTVCRSVMTVGLVGELREHYTDQYGKQQVQTVWDSLTVQGVGNDSVLYDNSKAVDKTTLPLRHDADSTVYTLTYHGLTDTLTTHYSSNQIFVSMECGCAYHHAISHIDHTRHWIDSIDVVNDAITREGKTNIHFIREHR